MQSRLLVHRYAASSSVPFLSAVDGGHRAVKYSRLFGVQKDIYMEGTHVMIPWLETPIIYDVRAKPSNVASLTGTKGEC